jgi:hypothetical protein
MSSGESTYEITSMEEGINISIDDGVNPPQAISLQTLEQITQFRRDFMLAELRFRGGTIEDLAQGAKVLMTRGKPEPPESSDE